MNASDLGWLPNLALGIVFVVFVSVARLRGHGADRSFTTFGRFCIAAICYCIFHLVLFFALLELADTVDTNAPTAAVHFLEANPAWLALVCVAMFAYLPPVSTLDRMVRSYARRIGGMPEEMYRLRDAISLAPRSITKEQFRELHFRLMRRGIDLGTRRGIPDQTLHSQLLQATELKCIIERCENDLRFSAFMRDNAPSLHELARSFDHAIFRMSRSAEAMGRLHTLANENTGQTGSWDALGAMVENQTYAEGGGGLDPVIATSKMLIANRRDDMRQFVDDASTLLARLTLALRRTERGRIRMLRSVGVKVTLVRRPRFSSLFGVFAVLVPGLVLSAYLFGSGTSQNSIRMACMVSISFVAALICAVYPKQYFPFANKNIYGHHPWMFYVAAGLAAGAISFAISLGFKLFTVEGVDTAFDKAVDSTPWQLLEVTLAVTVAVLIQDRFDAEGRRRIRGRWLDALVLAAAMTGAMVCVLAIFSFTRPDKPIMWWAIGLMAVIGGFLGFYVPARFRSDLGDAAQAGDPRMRPREITAAQVTPFALDTHVAV